MTERKVKLDRANKSILLRALGDVYYGQRAHGGSTEVTGRLILRVNDLPAGGKQFSHLVFGGRWHRPAARLGDVEHLADIIPLSLIHIWLFIGLR